MSILRHSDITDLDEELLLQRSVPLVESGVDKEEENETHLVAAIHSTNNKPVYIPTPDASQIVANYDRQHSKSFILPASFIRFSATVEDCEGCSYSLDERDDIWLQAFNQGRKENTQISANGFEWIIHQFESTINQKQPFLSTAPESILSFEELEAAFEEETPAKQYKAFAKFIYVHWRQRRIEKSGKPIMPLLKYEENAKDEGDPYVCFRRREVRQIRKTRRTDQQSSVKLKGLRSEMEQARNLVESVLKREILKRESLITDQDLFESRCFVKMVKRKLGIKGDDDDLVNHRQKKISEVTPSGSRLALRALPKHDESLLGIDEYFEDRNIKIRSHIVDKLDQLKMESVGWSDCTDSPYIGFPRSVSLGFFRYVRTLILNSTQSNAAASDLYSPNLEKHLGQYSSKRFAFRQRLGRGGRTVIDRRLTRSYDSQLSDRWACDFDSQEEVLDLDEGGYEMQ